MKNKPVIAIDCDDVIISTAPNIIDHYNLTYGTNIELKDYYSNDEQIWGADRNTFMTRVYTYLSTPEYQSLKPFQDALATIRELSNSYELHVVTARPDLLADITKKMLNEHFPDTFKSIIFTNHFSDKNISKADICSQLNASYLIDDHLHHAELAASSGLPVLLFGDYPWNQTTTLPDLITRVGDWQQVRDILLN